MQPSWFYTSEARMCIFGCPNVRKGKVRRVLGAGLVVSLVVGELWRMISQVCYELFSENRKFG